MSRKHKPEEVPSVANLVGGYDPKRYVPRKFTNGVYAHLNCDDCPWSETVLAWNGFELMMASYDHVTGKWFREGECDSSDSDISPPVTWWYPLPRQQWEVVVTK